MVDADVQQCTDLGTERDAASARETFSLKHAPRAKLDARARGKAAQGLVAVLADMISTWETVSGKRKNVRRKSLEDLKTAIAAFAADLLHACNHPDAEGWVYRPLAKEGFTGQAVSSRAFTAVKDAWIACDLL